MPGGVYKGLTIELDAKSTTLDRALKNIESKGKSIDKEMRQVQKSLKLDPSSPQAYARQMELLSQGAKNAADKLKALKTAEKDIGKEKMSTDQWTKLQYDIKQAEAEVKAYEREMRNLAVQHGAADSAIGKTGQKLEEIGQKTQVVGDRLQDLGGKLTAAFTATELAAATASVKTAVGFETSLAKVSTLVDTNVVDMEEMGEGARELAKQYGMSAAEINEALYQSISASVDAGDAVKFVGDATKLAKVGFTDAATSVDTLTTIINAYGMSAEETAHISDVLVNTQNLGKTTVNELGASMGQVIPTAAAYNVSLENLSSAYVVMTKQGINTANATTYLNGMMTELADEGSDVAKILKQQTGKSFSELMDDGESLGDVLGVIYDSVDGDSTAFANLWGNVRAGRGALAIANAGCEEFNETVGSMTGAVGIVDTAFEKLEGTTEEQFNRMKAEVEDAAISVGQALLPVVQDIIGAVKDVAEAFNAMDEAEQKQVIAIAAVVAGIGPALTVLGMLMKNVKNVGKGMMTFAELLAKVDIATGNFGKSTTKMVGSTGKMVTSATKASVAMGALKAGAAAAAVAGVALLVIAIKDYLKKAEAYHKATKGMVDKAKGLASVSDVVSGKAEKQATAIGKAAEKWVDYGKAAEDAAEKGKEFADSMDDAFGDAAVNAGLAQLYADKIAELAGNVGDSPEKLAELTNYIEKYNDLTGSSIEITDNATGAISLSSDELDANTEAYKRNVYARAAASVLEESLKRQFELDAQLSQAQQQLEEDTNRLAEAREKLANAKTPWEIQGAQAEVDEYASKVAKNQEAVDSLTEQLEAQTETTEILTEKQAEYASGMEKSEEEASDLAEAVDGIKDKTVKVVVDTTDALNRIQRVKDALSSTGASAIIPISGEFASGGISQVPLSTIPRHADGGISGIATGATLTNIGWVGENGAEAIVPLTNRRYVAPFAQAVASEINAGNSTVYNVSIDGATVNADPEIRAVFYDLMTTISRKKAMNVG